ncbi:MAG: HlyC/CorC family transporter [Fibrobacter sp.]|mgnify:CR=1 FL=1|nr:HlyC/CorC family transporter [Fibrobacter sp.]
MTGAWFELLIILILIFINGFFSMSEIAIISAHESYLNKKSREGIHGARSALNLKNKPNRFLPSIQVGITMVGIFMGTFSGKTIAYKLQYLLEQIPPTQNHAEIISILLVVVFISYLTLVLGELVPKRIALNNANEISIFVASPIKLISRIASPFVNLLGFSTDIVLSFLRVPPKSAPQITEEEISNTIELGRRAGLVEADEQKMVTRIFEFGDRPAHSIMTPRTEVIWLNITDSQDSILSIINETPFSYYPIVIDPDHVSGIISAKEILTRGCVMKSPIDLKKFLLPPLFISEQTPVLKVLEQFRKSSVHFAIVVDEYGGFSGIITPYDLLQAVVGELPVQLTTHFPAIRKLTNNTYEIDGALPIQEFKVFFRIDEFPEEQRYGTISGFVLMELEHIPEPGEQFEWNGMEFKVTEVKSHRISKVMIRVIQNEG